MGNGIVERSKRAQKAYWDKRSEVELLRAQLSREEAKLRGMEASFRRLEPLLAALDELERLDPA